MLYLGELFLLFGFFFGVYLIVDGFIKLLKGK